MLTRFAKQQIGLSMYYKGKAFLAAALILKREARKEASSEPVEYVVLYLLAQGVEVTLKGLLLLRNYDRHETDLRNLGHDLDAIATTAIAEFGLKRLGSKLADELNELSHAYKEQRLRYGSPSDIFIAPDSIPTEQVLRCMAAVIRLADRELSPST